MPDVLTKEQRSFNMSRIRGRDTKPELTVRRMLHAAGYRYQLHGKELPGKPDLVFASRRKVVFVHGCYWHSHDCRFGQVKPGTNATFWSEKRAATVLRDARNQRSLAEDRWEAFTVWECELKDPAAVLARLTAFLG